MWEDIEKEGEKFSGSWICLGDFNCVRDQSEKLHGLRVREVDTRDLRNLLARTCLQDIPASGYHYTWSNNHANSAERIWCKLDRMLGNDKWFEEMDGAQALFLPPGISDHCPGIIYWGEEKRVIKNFRYCNFWESLEGYDNAVDRVWNNGTNCRNLFMIQAKMKLMKLMLKQEFVGRTKGMDKRVSEIRDELLAAQSNYEHNPLDRELCAVERKLTLEFRKIKYNQFLFNKQRTNAQWIKEGDANTKFFHRLLKTRRSWNSINQITLQDGSISTDSGIIKNEFSVYFRELLGQARDCSPVDPVVVA
ncbi:hypothetical protein QQ045_003173 [Rhodiola kirilowii]